MEFVLPGYLGRIRGFKRQFASIEAAPGSTSARNRLRLLKTLMGPFLLRRMKADVVEELPNRTIHIQNIELSVAERAIYSSLENSYRKRVAYRMATVGYERAKFMMLEACCDSGRRPAMSAFCQM